MHKALGSIPNTSKRKEVKKDGREGKKWEGKGRKEGRKEGL
jgi:hypothetical protein